ARVARSVEVKVVMVVVSWFVGSLPPPAAFVGRRRGASSHVHGYVPVNRRPATPSFTRCPEEHVDIDMYVRPRTRTRSTPSARSRPGAALLDARRVGRVGPAREQVAGDLAGLAGAPRRAQRLDLVGHPLLHELPAGAEATHVLVDPRERAGAVTTLERAAD